MFYENMSMHDKTHENTKQVNTTYCRYFSCGKIHSSKASNTTTRIQFTQIR